MAQALAFDERVRDAYPDGVLWVTMGDKLREGDRLVRVLDLIRWWTGDDPPGFDTLAAASAHLRRTLTGARPFPGSRSGHNRGKVRSAEVTSWISKT